MYNSKNNYISLSKQTECLTIKITTMASNSETEHVKNVANFEILISRCQAYGAKYQPSKQALTILSLQALLEQAKADLATLTNKKNALDLAIDNHQIAFSGLKSLSTRIINAFKASDASDQTVEDAKSINNKIQGKRAKAIVETEDEATKKTISVVQLSFDSMLENFSHLVDLFSQEEHYVPNEEELKVETLQSYQTDLHTKNTGVINAQTECDTARIARNRTLMQTKQA